MRRIGLRIDVDTLRGTRVGVANLVRLLGKKQYKGDIFLFCRPRQHGSSPVASSKTGISH